MNSITLGYIYDCTIGCVALPFKIIYEGTYLYPFFGIYYCFGTPEMWKFYLMVLVPQFILTFLVYIITFMLFFPICTVIWSLLTGPFAFISVWVSVIQQSGAVAVFVVTNLFMPYVQKVTFDAVLSREFADDLLIDDKLKSIDQVPFLVKCGTFFTSISQFHKYLYVIAKGIFLFLMNAIPIVGPVLVICLQAPSKGLRSQARYFVLLGYTHEQIKQAYYENPGSYVGFGLAANILETVPFLLCFFMFTNNLGSALWVVSQERTRRKREEAPEHFVELDFFQRVEEGAKIKHD